MPYEGLFQPLHVLIVKCENGYGVDVTYTVEGEQHQKTYIATTLEQAISFTQNFFTEGKANG